MEFTIKTKGESSFTETLQNIVEENNIEFPNAITINRDTDYSTYILTDVFINRLNKLNSDLVKRLQEIR